MKKRLVPVILAVLCLLTACGEDQKETTAPTETTVDSKLEEQFQAEVALLTEYLENGTMNGEDATGMDPNKIFEYSYYGFLEVAEHPGAQEYLDRFVIIEDVALSQIYSLDGAVSEVFYAYDADGKLLSEPVVNGHELHRVDYIYSEADVYHGNVSQAREISWYQESGEEFQVNSTNYVYYDDGGLRMVNYGDTKDYYDEEGTLYQQVYDSGGWITGDYVAPYTEHSKKDYHYDENGVLTDTVRVFTHTSVNDDIEKYYFCYTYEEVTTYTADENGRIVGAYTSSDYDDVTTQLTYEYDDGGVLIREREDVYRSGELKTSTETVYTYEGERLMQAVTTVTYTLSSETRTLEYTYGDYIGYTVE